MTLREVIAWADRMKPDNRFTNEEKTTWINELEGMVQREALLEAAEVEYEYSTDAETELIVSYPYDKLYRHYLLSQISYANEEYDRYNNELEMFNACWRDFLLWVCSSVRPAYKKRDWLHPVFKIIRGETVKLEFLGLPTEPWDVNECIVAIEQKGKQVLELRGEQIEVGDNGFAATLTQEESLLLTPGAALVSFIIIDGAGNRYERFRQTRMKVYDTTRNEVS